MSMLSIAKFLKINKALYVGDDESRWFALPRSTATPRFRLMKAPSLSTGFFGGFGGDSRELSEAGSRRTDGYISG